MLIKTIHLNESFPSLKTDPTLTLYLHENFAEFCSPKRAYKTFLILPGGGYAFLSEREAEPIALRFFGYGYNAAVLRYSLGPYLEEGYPLLEGYAAIAYLRKNAEALHVDPSGLFVQGSSAGGHLAASLGAYWEDPRFLSSLHVTKEDLRINGLVLSYPVITMREGTHGDTRGRITLGKEDRIAAYSIESHVSPHFPPTFLWATANDELVPVRNSLLLGEALAKAKVPYELIVYPDGPHGASLADASVYPEGVDPAFLQRIAPLAEWPKRAITFFEGLK